MRYPMYALLALAAVAAATGPVAAQSRQASVAQRLGRYQQRLEAPGKASMVEPAAFEPEGTPTLAPPREVDEAANRPAVVENEAVSSRRPRPAASAAPRAVPQTTPAATPIQIPGAGPRSFSVLRKHTQSNAGPTPIAGDLQPEPFDPQQATDDECAMPPTDGHLESPSDAQVGPGSEATLRTATRPHPPTQGVGPTRDPVTPPPMSMESTEPTPAASPRVVPVEPKPVDAPSSVERFFEAGGPPSARASSRRTIPTPERQAELSPRRPADSTTDSQRTAAPAGQSNLLTASRAAALKVQTLGPRSISIGKSADYAVVVENAGDAAAENVVLTVAIPSWTEIGNRQATAGESQFQVGSAGDGLVKWTIPRLEPQHRQKLVLGVIPRDSRPFALKVNWTYTPASAQAQIAVLEPKLSLAVTGDDTILFGETKIYTIEVGNPGTGPAENVVLYLLPLEANAPAPKGTPIGVIPAGATKRLQVELTAREEGELAIRTQATADNSLRAAGNKNVQVLRAKLTAAAAGPTRKFAGSTGDFFFRVANVGNAPAREVAAIVNLPAGVQYLEASHEGVHEAASRRVGWSIGALAPGEHRDVRVRCRLIGEGEQTLRLQAVTGKTAATADAATFVEALADLKLTLEDPKGPLPTGEATEYVVRISNRGTKAAEGIQLTTLFSEGFGPVAVEGIAAEIDDQGIRFAPITRLAAGQELVLRVQARAAVEGNHILRVELACQSSETTLVSQETTRFYDEGAATPQFPAMSGRTPNRR